MTVKLVAATNTENNQGTVRFHFPLRKLYEFVPTERSCDFSGAAPTCKINPRFAESANA